MAIFRNWPPKLFALAVVLLLPLGLLAAEDASKQATDAATGWLTLIDAGQYDESWNQAATMFRRRVTQSQWAQEVKVVREPMGKVQSRAAAGARLVTSLPGAPDGHYAILQFRSKFASKADATETVTMTMQNDTWKAAGYFIK
jgi:hypothetical protein